MAIIEKTFYGLKCDGCGKVLEDVDINDEFYTDSYLYLDEVAHDSEWLTIRDKHYCPECYRYEDNDDLVLGDGTIIHSYEEDWI